MAKPKILIVDDDPTTRELHMAMLGDSGAELVFAVDGFQGMTAARQEDICLLLLDISMPGMSGYQVATSLRNDPRVASIPIVFVTGALLDEETGADQLLGEADLLLTKPVDREMLRQLARLFVRLHQRHEYAKETARELERLRRENVDLRAKAAAAREKPES